MIVFCEVDEFHQLFGWAVVLEEKMKISKIFLNPIISVPRPTPYPKESWSSRLSSEIAHPTTGNVFFDVHGTSKSPGEEGQQLALGSVKIPKPGISPNVSPSKSIQKK